MITTNQFKNGNHIEVDGTIFKIVEFQHVKPGKGGAFVRTKLRRASDGNVIDRTFRAGRSSGPCAPRRARCSSSTPTATDAHFMDTDSFEQIAVRESPDRGGAALDQAAEQRGRHAVHRRRAGDVQLPSAVDLEVTQTDPGLRGDTASGGGTKPATLETGATIQVPLFVESGQRVRVDTRSGDYVSRGLNAPLRPAAGGGRRPLPARPHRPAAGRHARPATPAFARALAQAAAERAEELDALIARHAHGWTVDRIQPLERSIMRVALVEMLHPGRCPGGRADPARGGDRRGGRERQDVLRGRRPGFVNGVLAAVLREVRENAAQPMSSAERLDELDPRLERAAEQLRSGELSPDAAATLVEDCAALATQAAAELERLARAEVAGRAAPGQDAAAC